MAGFPIDDHTCVVSDQPLCFFRAVNVSISREFFEGFYHFPIASKILPIEIF